MTPARWDERTYTDDRWRATQARARQAERVTRAEVERVAARRAFLLLGWLAGLVTMAAIFALAKAAGIAL